VLARMIHLLMETAWNNVSPDFPIYFLRKIVPEIEKAVDILRQRYSNLCPRQSRIQVRWEKISSEWDPKLMAELKALVETHVGLIAQFLYTADANLDHFAIVALQQ